MHNFVQNQLACQWATLVKYAGFPDSFNTNHPFGYQVNISVITTGTRKRFHCLYSMSALAY